MIPAAILLCVAAAAFDMGVHVPLGEFAVAFVGVPIGCLWFVRTLVRCQHASPPPRVRGEIVHRPPVYRIPRQDTPRLLRGRDDAA